MIILAIETSCDDTGVSVVRTEGKKISILSNIVSSQVKLHAKYGGVYPSLAKREHQKNLPVVFRKALKEAGNPKVDLVAVTIGHGLEPCLWMGVNFAKELAKKLKLSVVPVNHIEAHILVNFFDRSAKFIFPAMCLVVSGGHTGLILMEGVGKYRLIGETRDDAAGECFDKTARILGLGYPGGPEIAAQAAKYNIRNTKYHIQLPRPMISQKNYDFSFSGLKTAVLYDFKNRPKKIRESKEYIQEMASEIQQAAIDVLLKKTVKAAKDFRVKTVILGGGVLANKELRKQFKNEIKKELPKVQLLMPSINMATDNAAMVGIAAYFNRKKRRSWQQIKALANLRIK
ncbi:MAG: tRNA (adenosine(37)-N6)-threonylcarbamoyltransferase complex transferase subunit TsaD [bacterium]|nr:tRNA (adenosine(37)-N6)-threonylcarbamoyltransferase complex transferase subunit TsaD [bacterium]